MKLISTTCIVLAFHLVRSLPVEDRDECFNVITTTKTWADEITWHLGKCTNSQKFGNNNEYTQQCCLAAGDYTLSCKDSEEDGWDGGYLEIEFINSNRIINRVKYCDDFTTGFQQTATVTIVGAASADSVLGAWSDWSNCTVSCGGTKTRSRSCINEKNGGNGCDDHLTETRGCFEDPCPTSKWGIWDGYESSGDDEPYFHMNLQFHKNGTLQGKGGYEGWYSPFQIEGSWNATNLQIKEISETNDRVFTHIGVIENDRINGRLNVEVNTKDGVPLNNTTEGRFFMVHVEPISYTKQTANSSCCTGPHQFHEQCNFKADLEFCKEACDNDNNCKGYVGQKLFGENFCQIATTSSCPASATGKFHKGNHNNLNASISCGSGFGGCFIKQRDHCEFGDWVIGECSTANTCGIGIRTKTREMKVDSSNGGGECPGSPSVTVTESCLKNCVTKKGVPCQVPFKNKKNGAENYNCIVTNKSPWCATSVNNDLTYDDWDWC